MEAKPNRANSLRREEVPSGLHMTTLVLKHLLLGNKKKAGLLLKKLGISFPRASVEHNTKNTTSSNLKNVINIPLTRQTEKVLK